MEKPAKVEVGQRWQFATCSGPVVFTVTKVGDDGRAHFADVEMWKNSWNEADHMLSNVTGKWTYLGGPGLAPGVPLERPTWAVGQRRRIKTNGGWIERTLVRPAKGMSMPGWWEVAGNNLCCHESWDSELLGTTDTAKPAEVPAPDDLRRTVNEQVAKLPTVREIASPPKPTREPRREVSTNGRDWTDYDRLTDADPFEAYAWRRIDGVGAVCQREFDAVAARGKVVGYYGPNPREPRLGMRPTPWFYRAERPRPWSPADLDGDIPNSWERS